METRYMIGRKFIAKVQNIFLNIMQKLKLFY